MLWMKALLANMLEWLVNPAPGTDIFFQGNDSAGMKPIVGNFALDRNILLADLTFHASLGSKWGNPTTAEAHGGTDPLTGDMLITIRAPAGGWRWELATTPTEPITVYGYVVLNGGDDLLGLIKLDAPVTLHAASDEITAPDPVFRIPIDALS